MEMLVFQENLNQFPLILFSVLSINLKFASSTEMAKFSVID